MCRRKGKGACRVLSLVRPFLNSTSIYTDTSFQQPLAYYISFHSLEFFGWPMKRKKSGLQNWFSFKFQVSITEYRKFRSINLLLINGKIVLKENIRMRWFFLQLSKKSNNYEKYYVFGVGLVMGKRKLSRQLKKKVFVLDHKSFRIWLSKLHPSI